MIARPLARATFALSLAVALPLSGGAEPNTLAHGNTARLVAGWQAAFEQTTRAKVANERLRFAWAPDESFLLCEKSEQAKPTLWKVNPRDGTLTRLLDESTAKGPWQSLRVGEGGRVFLQRDKQWWLWNESKGELEQAAAPPPDPPAPEPQRPRRRSPRRSTPGGGPDSPDGRWRAEIRDHDVWLIDRKSQDHARCLSDAGTPEHPFAGEIRWAPDSSRFALWRVRKAQPRLVRLVEAAPKDQLQPKSRDLPYPKPGDRVETRLPWVFCTDDSPPLPPDEALTPNPFECGKLAWRNDSRRLTWEFTERGYGKFQVIEIDAAQRSQRVLVDESSDTFVFVSGKTYRHDLDDGREIVWMSERDGWNHLYLLDGATGQPKRQLTKGEWVVRSVRQLDNAKRQLLIEISGCWPGQDPYFIHYARVGIDDAKLVPLTRADGNHDLLEFSPGGNYYVCRWSRVDKPPVHELRRAADGTLVQTLAEADASALLATGWRAPEPFMAKDREGKFDIWGIIVRPPDFDPAKNYPVIEDLYAGPQDSFVPKSWNPWNRNQQELARCGFVVVQIDGRGTSNRCREFHHFCYKNLKDAGLPDRIAWLKAAAAKYPQLDLARVGVFGGSAGGQSALGAVLFHGDFYRAAAADCGCHDNRMDKIWWNEQWMDWPLGPHYADNSNTTHASKLQGALLLTVGALDDNVDPSSTMQVVQALIDADKEFELVVFPRDRHGAGESGYGRARRARFFQRHLGTPVPR
jgi:dipeptidyl aminopeptidase/acylaminoacyl peptidase